MSVGTRIRELRRLEGFTIEQLADKVSTSKSYIWELERGITKRPSASKLSKIAEALKTTSDYLLHGSSSREDALDTAFYKLYLKQNKRTKAKIRMTTEIIIGDQ